jgi:UDP-N-acetylglucosamine 1-carboxyvinyltransferase
MSRYIVRSGSPLAGAVPISGATKNSGLKQMAAALLAPGTTVLHNMCPVADLAVMIDVMRAVGCAIDVDGDAVRIDTSGPLTPEAPYDLVRRLRASVNVLGPLLVRCGEARVALPGGDNIGNRRLDMHFRGLEAMGAEIRIVHGFIEARAPQLFGARHVLEFPSNGATENLLSAAVLAKGTTVIENAAREPEITDLCAFLTRMGAHVVGGGTATIEIEGVESLTPVESTIGADRIEAATLLIACGIAGGEIMLEGASVDHLEMLALKLGDMGMRVSPSSEGIWARADGRLRAVDLVTLPHPGFATDVMPPMVALLAVADGNAIVTENIYDNRFGFTLELNRMGADIRTEGRHAVVRGVERLSGAPVTATDVRAGAALMLAALAADGVTEIYGIDHVERGYGDLVGKLRALGADVERVS